MRIAVTGAAGFVGRHLLERLLAAGHAVTAVVRREPPRQKAGVDWIVGDIAALAGADLARVASADVVAHLAWAGLDDLHDPGHLDTTLPQHMAFLRALVDCGARRLLVTGTCLEYGLREGALAESLPSAPVTAYGAAKDALHRYLVALARRHPLQLQWARLFYLRGAGQHPGSVLSQLERAVAAGADRFAMSGGEQLRDVLRIEEAAERLARVLATPALQGPVNIGNGTPVSIRRLVETRLAELDATLTLDLGRYPYPAHEPMAFWADTTLYARHCGDRPAPAERIHHEGATEAAHQSRRPHAA